jgi:hypothetical protein
VRILLPVLYCLALIPTGAALGQEFKSDTAFIATAKASAIRLYTVEAGVKSNFYNGSEYYEYSPQADEHPYLDPNWKYGSVLYGRELYTNVPLLLDIADDDLITTYSHGNAIRLVHDKVESFTIEEDRFRSINDPQVPRGFYQVVYEGETSFMIRRAKTFHARIEGNTIQNDFDLKVVHYVVKDGIFHIVRGERSLLSALGDHRQELKKFIRERKIEYRSNKEKSAYAILQYYDQLTP